MNYSFARTPVLLVLALMPAWVWAQRFREPLGPKTFQSPHQNAKLWVNPSSSEGAGSAYCRLTVGGKILWQRELPFTLVDAAVAEDGRVGGYAYTGGKQWDGEFVTAILSSRGRVVLEERIRRTQSRFLHMDPDPKAMGIILDLSNDRMIVRRSDPNANSFGE